MSEMVPESALDRLHWLVAGKPTASEWENLGAAFNPQFHFMALLPAPSLPAGEASKVQHYFDAMCDVLAPVRDLIAAYSLRGVMSRAPLSDFALEVQFSDPYVVDMVRRSLPRALSASVVAQYRRHENTPTTEAEGSMFFRDKTPQETPDQATAAQTTGAQTTGGQPPAAASGPTPESAPAAGSPFHVPAAATPATVLPAPVLPMPVLPEPVYATLLPASAPSRAPGRKKMLVAEGITVNGGDILGCAELAIEGEMYSTIDRCEKLEILPGGIFKGTASVAEAEISGYCTGTLVVKGTLRITGTGHVIGSIQYGRLQVEDGGRIEGEMKLPAKSGEKPSDNPRWAELSAKVSAA